MLYNIQTKDDCLEISGLSDFSASQIFDCGQCFRFNPCDTKNEIAGTAFGKYIRIHTVSDDTVRIYGTNEEDFKNLWSDFLSLDTDYTEVKSEIISAFDTILGHEDDVIRTAVQRGNGIRILRQQPWETLISFIISQNNNIPRIKKIIDVLCRTYGTPINTPDGIFYSFPTPEAIYSAGEEGIFALKTGFRAKYIIDAAARVLSGECNLDSLRGNSLCSSTESAEQLMKIKGVGPKVAACVNLFGLGRIDAFPVDVWIKRVIASHYPDGLDYMKIGRYAGIAQQYLFYNERWQ